MKNNFKILFLILVLNVSLYSVDNIQKCLISYDQCVSECEEQDGCMSEQMDCMDLCRDTRDKCIEEPIKKENEK